MKTTEEKEGGAWQLPFANDAIFRGARRFLRRICIGFDRVHKHRVKIARIVQRNMPDWFRLALRAGGISE